MAQANISKPSGNCKATARIKTKIHKRNIHKTHVYVYKCNYLVLLCSFSDAILFYEFQNYNLMEAEQKQVKK